MEDYGSSISEGVYRTGDYGVMELYTGLNQRFEDEEHYRVENYKNGRLASAREVPENGRFAGIVQGKINNKKHVLQPYLGEFSKLLKDIEKRIRARKLQQLVHQRLRALFYPIRVTINHQTAVL